MRKRFYLIIFLIILLTVTALTAITIQDNNINEKINNVKAIVGLETKDNYEPEDKYEVVTIEVNNYDELKKEIEKTSKKENKSYIFNLNDGDYNITDTITCGNYHNDAQYTINGNNHIIDGNNKQQFMKAYSNLKIKDLTVQNTVPVNTNSSSGITMITASELYMKNCSFINNYGKNKGSAVTNRGTGHIIGCTFINNTVDELGGAIWSNGEFGGSITIKDCIFKENIANIQTNNDKTSIVYMVSYGNNTIENNQFINNTGRCIHSFNQTNTIIINNKFIDNHMDEEGVIRGGLIDNYEADIQISGNEFINDTTKGELRGGILYHEIGNMEFTDNKVENINIKPDPTSISTCSKGGVIFNRNATVKIENNEFNNVLIGNYSRGGVIYNNLGNITIKGNKFNNSIEGNHLRGLIVFNDVNGVLSVGNNTLNTSYDGSLHPKYDDENFYNSDVPNEEGNGIKGVTNFI